MTSEAWGGFDQLNLQLFNHLMQKACNSDVPLKVRALCRDFIESTDGSSSVDQLIHRVNAIRAKVHELKELDMETKVRMLFVLSGSVDEYFMKEVLETEGVTMEVDDRNRIVKYERRGGLKLKGQHSATGYKGVSDEDREIERKMMHFLADKSKNATEPLTANRFLVEFKEKTAYIHHVSRLLRRYNFVRSNIYGSTEYDKELRIRMLFVSGAKIPDRLLQELQIGATVFVDNENRITEYISDDRSLKLQGDHNPFTKKKDGSRKRSGVGEDLEMEDNEEDIFYDDDSMDVPSTSRKRGPREGSNDDYSAKRAPRPNEPSTSGPAVTPPVRRLTDFVNNIPVQSPYEELEEADDELHEQANLPYVLPMRGPVTIKAEKMLQEQFYNYPMQNNVPEIVDNRSSSSTASDTQQEKFTSTRKVLGALRNLVCTLDDPRLAQLQQNIESAIRDCQSKGNTVPFDALGMVIQSSLVIANISASEGIPSEDSESLREFLRLYQCSLYSLDTSSLNEIHKVFKDYVVKLKDSNKRITVKKIQSVIESVLALVV